MADFARALPNPQYLIAPAIDPFSGKNCELSQEFIEGVENDFGLDPTRPLLLQVSRFDRFKDPVGVIKAFRLTKPLFLPPNSCWQAAEQPTPRGGCCLGRSTFCSDR
ncbi:MAG: hypothetical protein ACUVQG_14915 [Thermogutta sp.]